MRVWFKWLNDFLLGQGLMIRKGLARYRGLLIIS